MIHLKRLVENNEKEITPDVLFVTDVESQRRHGFARKLISNGLVQGDIEIYPTNDIRDIISIMHYNVSPTVDDLIVVYYSGFSDESYLSVTENLSRIIDTGHKYGIPIVLITIPTPRFVKKYDSKERQTAIIRNKKINNWILNSTATYIVDLSKLTDDTYFAPNGEKLSIQGNVEIYKQLVRILSDIDSSIDVESEDEKIDAELRAMHNNTIRTLEDLQMALLALGYKIRFSEISQNKFGKTTKKAIIKFKQDNAIFPHDSNINKQLLTTLLALNEPEEEESVDLTGTVKYIAGASAENVQLVIDYLTDNGITNPYTQIGILCTIGKESGFEPQDEIPYNNTPNDKIRQTFGDRVPDDDAELDALKSDPEAFFNHVYGGLFGNAPDEGYLYRGRGFNGLTYKGNYRKYGALVGEDLVGDPELANNPDVAAKIAVKFFTKGRPASAMPEFDNVDSAITYFVNLNAGGTGRAADHSRAKAWADKFIIEH